MEGSVPEGLKTRTWPQGEIPLKGRQTPFDYLERMHKYKKKGVCTSGDRNNSGLALNNSKLCESRLVLKLFKF